VQWALKVRARMRPRPENDGWWGREWGLLFSRLWEAGPRSWRTLRFYLATVEHGSQSATRPLSGLSRCHFWRAREAEVYVSVTSRIELSWTSPPNGVIWMEIWWMTIVAATLLAVAGYAQYRIPSEAGAGPARATSSSSLRTTRPHSPATTPPSMRRRSSTACRR
jgi:hypothetical protein